MSAYWYRRVVRLMAGPVAAVGVIGGAMGMSAIAHAHPGPMPTSMVVGHLLSER